MAVDTIPSLFHQAVKTHDKADAFQHKRDGKYTNISHKQTFESVDKASRGLSALNLTKGDRVAFLANGRVVHESTPAELAADPGALLRHVGVRKSELLAIPKN